MATFALIKREGIITDEVIFPNDIYDIPGLSCIDDIKVMELYAEEKLTKFKGKSIDLYITGGLTVSTIAVLNVAYCNNIIVNAMHRNMYNGMYSLQKIFMDYETVKPMNTMFEELKVCTGRHFGVPGKEIFDIIPDEKILDMKWLQDKSDVFLKDYANKSVRLFITGLTQALFAILNSAQKYNIAVTAMHFNKMTDEYFAQEVYHNQ